jgi:outer membrane scaffolding protein for murein synthesis (MipA/OmpV family)
MMKGLGFDWLLDWATLATEKRSTVEDVSKATKRTGLVLAAFVATHGA